MSNLTSEITERLLQWAPNKGEIVFPNIYIGRYEMDVMLIKGTDYIYEYEIKVSRGDFKNDFNKNKRRYQGRSEDGKEAIYLTEYKHDLVKEGKDVCNRFFFVVPKDMISLEECPNHAGLIYYEDGRFKTVKKARLLHRNKFNNYKYRG